MTKSQFDGLSTLSSNWFGPTVDLYVNDAGTHGLCSKTIALGSQTLNLNALYSTADLTLVGDSEDGQTLTAGSGADTLQSSTGANDVLNGGLGNDTRSTARPCANHQKNPPSVASLTPTTPSKPLKPSMGAAVRDRSESLSAVNRNTCAQSPESAILEIL